MSAHLVCNECHKEFDHPIKRGRKPNRCLECRAKPQEVKTRLSSVETVDRLTLNLMARGTHISQNRGDY